MTKEELADRILELDLSSFNYVSDVIVNHTKCDRDGVSPAEVGYDLFGVLAEIEGIVLEYEDSR